MIPENSDMLLDNDLELYKLEYIDMLDNPNDMTDFRTFNGMLLYINNKCIKYNTDYVQSFDILDTIFDWYTIQCGLYKQKPNLKQFLVFISMNHSELYNIINSIDNSNGMYKYIRLSSNVRFIIQKWFDTTCAVREIGAQNNSIGDMYLCKVYDGMIEGASDQPNQQTALFGGNASVETLPDLSSELCLIDTQQQDRHQDGRNYSLLELC